MVTLLFIYGQASISYHGERSSSSRVHHGDQLQELVKGPNQGFEIGPNQSVTQIRNRPVAVTRDKSVCDPDKEPASGPDKGHYWSWFKLRIQADSGLTLFFFKFYLFLFYV